MKRMAISNQVLNVPEAEVCITAPSKRIALSKAITKCEIMKDTYFYLNFTMYKPVDTNDLLVVGWSPKVGYGISDYGSTTFVWKKENVV